MKGTAPRTERQACPRYRASRDELDRHGMTDLSSGTGRQRVWVRRLQAQSVDFLLRHCYALTRWTPRRQPAAPYPGLSESFDPPLPRSLAHRPRWDVLLAAGAADVIFVAVDIGGTFTDLIGF